MRDMVAKSRQVKGKKNGRSKLTIKEVKEIRRLYRVKKISYSELRRRLGIHYINVRWIVRSEYWKYPLAEYESGY